MPSIKYETEGGAAGIKVRLGRKIIGRIKKVEGGYQYWPGGTRRHANPADVKPTVREVKRLIEGSDE